MTQEEALKLRIDDPLFIYDPGLDSVYEARVVGIYVPPANYKRGLKGAPLKIDAWSKKMGARTYEPQVVHGTEKAALDVQSRQLQHQADKLLNKKFEIDQRIAVMGGV